MSAIIVIVSVSVSFWLHTLSSPLCHSNGSKSREEKNYNINYKKQTGTVDVDVDVVVAAFVVEVLPCLSLSPLFWLLKYFNARFYYI